MSSAENCFITQLLVEGNMNIVLDSEINIKYLNGNSKEGFKFISEYFMKYSRLPSVLAFRRRFPDYELQEVDGVIGTEDSLQYWCDELRLKKKHNIIVDTMEKAMGYLETFDTDKAHNILKNAVLKVENELVKSDKVSVNSNTAKRKELYLKRQKTGGMTGLPTGIKDYDELTGGQNKGELTGTMGFTGVGKSFKLIIQAVAQAKMGIRVFLGTTEMSTEMMMRRIDAVWCGFNYTKFIRGQLSKKDEEKYFKYLQDIEGNEDKCLIVEHIDDVLQFSAKIDQHKPETAYLDGAYILQDEDSDSDHQSFRMVVRGLHQICLAKNIPIEFTTQAKEETGNTLKTINFSKAIAQEVDCFVALEQDAEMKESNEIKIKFLKQREGKIGASIFLKWDFDSMDYSTIYKTKQEVEVAESKAIIKID